MQLGSTNKADLVVIGGGIVGLSTGLALATNPDAPKPLILEKESDLAFHQSGHNSGVLHSGLYYKPGSLKARLAVAGCAALKHFCRHHSIPFKETGKVVVAATHEESERLQELWRRARMNGVPGVEVIGRDRLKDIEPHVRGLEALWVPSAGSVDYRKVAAKYAEVLTYHGGRILLGCRFLRAIYEGGEYPWRLLTTKGEFLTKFLVTCAGLYSDRVARQAGAHPSLSIMPFRGEYLRVKPSREYLCRGLIYPVPDPSLPFLGVHLTRTVTGMVEAGPNAVAAFSREGYKRGDLRVTDALESLFNPGLWRLAGRFWKTAIHEEARSWSRQLFVRSLQKLVPEIEVGDLEAGGSGVRAQALTRSGELVDDFRIESGPRSLHVLNAPSPAATASLAIGESIARAALELHRS